MKWVLIVLGVLVALVALMAVIGLLVPRDHVAGASITLRQSADTIWKVIRDLGGVPQWWPETKSSVRTADKDGHERWEQDVGGFTMAAIIETDDPPRRLVTRIDSPPGASFGGTWTYEIAPVPEGTRVTVTERGWIANSVFRFLSRFVFGYYGTQEKYLKALGTKFGETVTPVRVSNP
ncbi:MAG TPA: SRPBCC family protein [Gemmatimonadales bacterium]|nr:SRPBCC family protein [Gemmatimonadales bacterium]